MNNFFMNSGSLSDSDKYEILSNYFVFKDDIKQKYGDFDTQYDLIRIGFHNKPPETIVYPNKKIIIWLSKSKINEKQLLLWQLSHECIHLISPETNDKKEKPNKLEEGLATFYARDFALNNFKCSFDNSKDEYSAKCIEDADMVNNLLNFDQDIIKNVRKLQPSLSRITKNDLIATNPNLDPELYNNLCMTF